MNRSKIFLITTVVGVMLTIGGLWLWVMALIAEALT